MLFAVALGSRVSLHSMRPWLSWKGLAVGLALVMLGVLLWPRRGKPAPALTESLCEQVWEGYSQTLAAARSAKDSIFRVGSSSPIPEAERGRFLGLRYFPMEARWRLRGRYEPLPGALAPVIGALWLDLPALDSCRSPIRLLVYGEREGGAYVAFWDSTAALGFTYEGGRYVPVDIAGDSACIDFNRAYFPYCAYNPRYICLPYPPQNRFCMAILAGERW